MPDKWGNFTVDDGLKFVQGIGEIEESNRIKAREAHDADVDASVLSMQNMQQEKDPAKRLAMEAQLRAKPAGVQLDAATAFQVNQKQDFEAHKVMVQKQNLIATEHYSRAEGYMASGNTEGAMQEVANMMTHAIRNGTKTTVKKVEGKEDMYEWSDFDAEGNLLRTTMKTGSESWENARTTMASAEGRLGALHAGERERQEYNIAQLTNPYVLKNEKTGETIKIVKVINKDTQNMDTVFIGPDGQPMDGEPTAADLFDFTLQPRIGEKTKDQAIAAKYGAEAEVAKEKVKKAKKTTEQEKIVQDFAANLPEGSTIKDGEVVTKQHTEGVGFEDVPNPELTKKLHEAIAGIKKPKGVGIEAKKKAKKVKKQYTQTQFEDAIKSEYPDFQETYNSEDFVKFYNSGDSKERKLKRAGMDSSDPQMHIELLDAYEKWKTKPEKATRAKARFGEGVVEDFPSGI